MLVKVHAVMWVDGGVVVHEERRQGVPQLTLPGGRVRDRESLEDALAREIAEELDARVEVGSLQYIGEVVHGHSVHEIGLVFAARLLAPQPDIMVIDPRTSNVDVLPPIMSHIVADGPDGAAAPRWLGNIWMPRS